MGRRSPFVADGFHFASDRDGRLSGHSLLWRAICTTTADRRRIGFASCLESIVLAACIGKQFIALPALSSHWRGFHELSRRRSVCLMLPILPGRNGISGPRLLRVSRE